MDQFLCMAFAQLAYRERLRDIEAGLGAQPAKLYQPGIRENIIRSNLGDVNEVRNWRIYHEFYQALSRRVRRSYTQGLLSIDLDNMKLCTGLRNHQSVSVDVPLTAIPQDQNNDQTAYPTRSAQYHSRLYLHPCQSHGLGWLRDNLALRFTPSCSQPSCQPW